MAIKQNFTELLIYTTIMLVSIIIVGTQQPVFRIPCLCMAGIVLAMFIYTGKAFIRTENRRMDAAYRPQQEKKLGRVAKRFIDDNWSEKDEME